MARGSLFKTGKLKPALRECERPLESAEGERLENFIRGLKQGIRARMGKRNLRNVLRSTKILKSRRQNYDSFICIYNAGEIAHAGH